MRMIILTSVFILMTATAHARDVFPYEDIRDLRVVDARSRENVAWVVDANGFEEEITLEDTLGSDGSVVMEIREGSIMIRRGNTRIIMPVFQMFLQNR